MVHFASITGIVESFILNPKGKVDGLLLNDNRQLRVPSHLRRQLTESVTVGSAISAEVKEGTESGYGQQLRLHRWLNGSAHDPQARVVQGTVSRWLVDKKGHLRGFILTDETQILLPKSLRKEISPRLKLGAKVGIEGSGAQTPFGTAVKARKLFIDGITFEKE